MNIAPAKTWAVGHRFPDSAAVEVIVGQNWWEAAAELLEQINQWALDDDRARGDTGYGTSRTVGSAWYQQPPIYDQGASYEIADRDGRAHTFYLAAEQ